MADLNFPTSPLDGDTYGDYVYDSATESWILNSDILLSNAKDVDFSGLADGDTISYSTATSKWVANSGRRIPVGALFPYPSLLAPEGYISCQGQILSQTEYADLYSVVGSLYNIGGEPSGSFRIPNLTSRVPVGYSSGVSEFDPVGKYSGGNTHRLTISELPSHTHTQDAHSHSQNAHNHTQDSHSHSATTSFYNYGGNFGYGYFGSFRNRVGVTGGWGLGTTSAQPTINGTAAVNQNATAQNMNTGGDVPHNNTQPYLTLNYVIKY